MSFKTINVVFLICVVLSPVFVHTISSFIEREAIVLSLEETEEESKKEKDFDDLEEYLLSQKEELSQLNNKSLLYSFNGKYFIHIVSDIITPPPER